MTSLRAGVVPSTGFQHIQVARVDEVNAMLRDIERIADGGSSVRLVIGEYGSGKTFFLNLLRSVAAEKKLVTVRADMTPDRRLQGTGGQARALYAELMRNMSTRTNPDGGALPAVVEKFISSARAEAQERGSKPVHVIHERAGALSEMVAGYDFAAVVTAYWEGHESGNDKRVADAVRWLRGEYTTKTEARAALGVRTIIDDAMVYDALKLLARFCHLAGYGGLLVCLDEMVNLYKMGHAVARKANYEQVLRIFNDCMQGRAQHLGFVFSGTPDMLTDNRRGLYSYEALRSRLAENTFGGDGIVDFTGPVLRLANLTPEDLYVLLTKLRHVHASGDPERYQVPDEALTAFMQHCRNRVGDAYFRTPRNTIKAFLDLLVVLEQNQKLTWTELLDSVAVAPDDNPDHWLEDDDSSPPGADELASFRL